MYMIVLPMCFFVHRMYAMPMKARKVHWIPWDWNYRQLLDAGSQTQDLWKSTLGSSWTELSL